MKKLWGCPGSGTIRHFSMVPCPCQALEGTIRQYSQQSGSRCYKDWGTLIYKWERMREGNILHQFNSCPLPASHFYMLKHICHQILKQESVTSLSRLPWRLHAGIKPFSMLFHGLFFGFIYTVTNKKPAQASITKVKQFEGSTSFVRRSQWMLEQLRQVNGIDPHRVSI